jgi:hypothetical protein
LAEKGSAQQRRAGTHCGAIQKITPRSLAAHTQLAIVFIHRAPLSSAKKYSPNPLRM